MTHDTEARHLRTIASLEHQTAALEDRLHDALAALDRARAHHATLRTAADACVAALHAPTSGTGEVGFLQQAEALRAAVARLAVTLEPHTNILQSVTSTWEHTHTPGEVPCHSRMVNGVLCRWWGDTEPPGVRLIDAACEADHHRATLRAAALRVLEAYAVGTGLEAALMALGAVMREGEAQ